MLTDNDVYSKRGFRGLLYELWKSEPQQKLKKILNNGTTDLIKYNNSKVMETFYGKQTNIYDFQSNQKIKQ